MSSRRTVDYEVVLYITGWCPGYAGPIQRHIQEALEAGGFEEGHLRFQSVSELAAPEPLVGSPTMLPATAGSTKERKTR